MAQEFDDGVLGEIKAGYGPLSASFTTQALYRPDEAIELDSSRAPFEGVWRFEPFRRGAPG